MQQKIQFIATLLHNPSLLIFDEPLSGLDPITSELLRDIILELRDDGRTILFASHRMEQVEQLCDDICLMAEGEIVLQGALRGIKSRFGRNSLILEFEGDDSFIDDLAADGHVRIETRVATTVLPSNLLDGGNTATYTSSQGGGLTTRAQLDNLIDEAVQDEQLERRNAPRSPRHPGIQRVAHYSAAHRRRRHRR